MTLAFLSPSQWRKLLTKVPKDGSFDYLAIEPSATPGSTIVTISHKGKLKAHELKDEDFG